jgi:hypothetical protein
MDTKKTLIPYAQPFLKRRQLCSNSWISPTFYGTRRFIAVFARVLYWPLSYARWIHSIPFHLIYIRSILTLSSHLRVGLHSGLFSAHFPAEILRAFTFSPMCAICPVPFHAPCLDLSNYIWRRVKVMTLPKGYHLDVVGGPSIPHNPESDAGGSLSFW